MAAHNDPVTNFDIRRFTLVGWLLFAVSLGVGFVCLILVNVYYDQIMDTLDDWLDPCAPKGVRATKYVLPMAIAGVAGAFAVFFGGMCVLQLAGVQVIRPKTKMIVPDDDEELPPRESRR